MRTSEERAKHTAYMRGWTARNRDRLNQANYARYRSDDAFRERFLRGATLVHLRKRGGVDDDTIDYVPIIRCDPCVYCGCEIAPQGDPSRETAIDHIDPAGDSNWTNLAGCCRSCNASKGKVPLLLSMLERQIRRDLTPLAEQLWLIKGRTGQRRRIEF